MACPKKGAFRTPRYVGPDPLLRQVLAPLAQFPPWPNLLPWSPGGGGVGAGGPDLPATNPPWAPGDGFRPGDDVPVICVPNSSGGCDYWPITPNRPGCDCSNCTETGSISTCSHFSEMPDAYQLVPTTTLGAKYLRYSTGCTWETEDAFSWGSESAKATLVVGGTGIQDVTLTHGGKVWKNTWDWCPMCPNEMKLICSSAGVGAADSGSSTVTDVPCIICINPYDLGLGSGSGSGMGGDISVDCCGGLLSSEITLTFSGVSGCADMDGGEIAMTWNSVDEWWESAGYSIQEGTYLVGSSCLSSFYAKLTCGGSLCSAFELLIYGDGAGTDCMSNNQYFAESGCTCSPLVLTFIGMQATADICDCCTDKFGTWSVKVTETA